MGPTGKLGGNGLKMIKIRVFLKGKVGLAIPGPSHSGVPDHQPLSSSHSMTLAAADNKVADELSKSADARILV